MIVATALQLTVALTLSVMSEGPSPLLDPTEYVSSSGEFVLHVNPSQKEGQGKGTYTFSRRGEVVWKKELPFTFWEAIVLDDGRSAGYAYTNGWRDLGAQGRFVVAVLSPDGEIALEESVPRKGSNAPHSAPDPKARGLHFHEELDHVVVRVNDPDVNRNDERWWVYSLDARERVATVVPRELMKGPDLNHYSHDARPIPDSPLTLAHWATWPRSGDRFILHDESFAEIWSLDLPEAPNEGTEAEGPAIIATAPLTFEIGDPAKGERVSLRIRRDGSTATGWGVEDSGRVEHASSESPVEPPPEFEPIELRHVATVALEARRGQQPAGVVGAAPSTTTRDETHDVLLDHWARLLVQDRRSGAVHVYDRTGALLTICEPDPGDFPDGAPPRLNTIAVSGDGSVYACTGGGEYVEFSPRGERKGRRTLGQYALFIPGSSSWLRQAADDYRAIELVSSSGLLVATIERRPDETWLRGATDIDVLSDGTIAILEAKFATHDDHARVSLYGPGATPRTTIAIPKCVSPYALAFSGAWIALEASEGVDERGMYLLRVRDHQVFSVVVDVPDRDSPWWISQFTLDGRELWWLNTQTLQLHRFELPAD